MRSPALALAWQLWRPNRWGLGGVAFGLAVLAVLSQTLPAGAGTALAGTAGVLFCVAFVYLLSVVVYTELDSASRGGFPRRMFTLPLRTTALVGWPMLYGMTAAVLLWLATAWLVLVPCGLHSGGAFWLAPVFAALAASFQAIAWAFVGSPLLRLVVAVGVLPSFVLAGIYHGVFATEEGVVGASALVIAIAYPVAVLGVARDRRGGGSLLAWLRRRFERAGAWLP